MRDEAHATLDRLLDAVERALFDDSPELQNSARVDVRRLWLDLTRNIDRYGVLSEAYRESVDPDKQTPRDVALKLAARVLGDLGGEEGALRGSVAIALAAVGAGIIDLLEGHRGTGILDSVKRGQGNRKQSMVVTHAAWPVFVRMVHYKSGRDDQSVEASFHSLRAMIGWSTFKSKQQKLSRQARKTARDVGAAVREGAPLTPEEKAVADDCEAILIDSKMLKKLMNVIVGEFTLPA